MLFQILKKDMMKRKGVNAILFLFITLSTIFLSSSVNNIMIVGSAVDYYMNYADVPDINVVINSDKDTKDMNAWLKIQKESHLIEDFDYNTLHILPNKSLKVDTNNPIDSNGATLYIGTMDADYSKVFDEEGKTFTLQKDELALSTSLMNRNHLKVGDTLILQEDGMKKRFTIAVEMKDAAFGNDMVGMARIMMNPTDYQEVKTQYVSLGLYYIETSDGTAFTQRLNNEAYSSVINVVSKSMYKMVYSFDMIMAALLILIGVCLILIALLVLRFTLVFTMEEQYQEIGILKAIGLRNNNIKKLYLVKYFVIVSLGAITGLFISIPISKQMISSVSENMIMSHNEINIGINILCATIVVTLVLSFCYFCTRRLHKISAISAIHGGHDGESFGKHKGLSLHKHLHMPLSLYLGCNDIIAHLRRYAVLMITFCISIILITIPLNTLNTMSSPEMLTKFLLDPDKSVYVREIETKAEGKYMSVPELKKGVDRLHKELANKGFFADLSYEAIFFFNYQSIGKEENRKIMTIQILQEDTSFANYSDGVAPVLENEVAFSKTIMEEEGWSIGDYVSVKIHDENKRMLITGTYTDYMQLGLSARLNPKINTDREILFDYWSVMVDMDIDKTQSELAKDLKKQFPDYEWLSGQELINENIGGIQELLKEVVFPMTLMLCLIIMLITLLMEKLFVTREKSEIAMMKSIGFRYRSIFGWQITRMCMVVLASMVIAIPLSFISNQFLLKPIFAIMGAEVNIQVNALEVYILYPGILLAGIIIATVLALLGIKRVDIREMNNLE